MRNKQHPPWYGCAHIAPLGVSAIWQLARVMSGSVQIGAPTLRLSQAVLAGPTAGIKCTDRAESSWTRPIAVPVSPRRHCSGRRDEIAVQAGPAVVNRYLLDGHIGK